MGVSTREKGVLKLVHPRRHVEIYREPITAAEVMRKNPRHCITRPDVFEFPWIVVRPESVLVPGEVFYVVPNRTIYRLLKARGQRDQPSPNQDPSPNNHDHPCEQDSNVSPVEPSHVDSLPKVIVKNKYNHREHKKKSPVDSSVSTRSSHSKIYHFAGENSGSPLPRSENEDQQIRSCEQDIKFRSCLRKQDSVRNSNNLRVTFALPTMMTSAIDPPSLQQNGGDHRRLFGSFRESKVHAINPETLKCWHN